MELDDLFNGINKISDRVNQVADIANGDFIEKTTNEECKKMIIGSIMRILVLGILGIGVMYLRFRVLGG